MMVTGFSLINGRATPPAIVNPLSRNGGKRHHRRSRRYNAQHIITLSISAIIFAVVLLYLWIVSANEVREKSADAKLLSNTKYDQQHSLSSGGSSRRTPLVHTSSIDTVIRYLNELAQKPAQLWDVLGMENANYGDDPFSLRELESGKCPWSTETTVQWLPPRAPGSEAISEIYRTNMEALRKGSMKPAKTEVLIWYEHISKAGGTTFCGLAQSNMLRWQVPSYHW